MPQRLDYASPETPRPNWWRQVADKWAGYGSIGLWLIFSTIDRWAPEVLFDLLDLGNTLLRRLP